METGKQQLVKFNKRWRLFAYLEVFLYAIGLGLFTYFLITHVLLSVAVFLASLVLLLFLKNPWRHTIKNTSAYIDAHIAEASFSTELLLKPKESLSNLARLQQYKVSKGLQERLGSLTPPHKLGQAGLFFVVFLAFGLIGSALNMFNSLQKAVKPETEQIQFIALDSLDRDAMEPIITEQRIMVTYPGYTRMGSENLAEFNIKAIINSNIGWTLKFNNPVTNVWMEVMGESFPLQEIDGGFTISKSLLESGFYSFKFENEDGAAFTSNLFSLEAIPDEAPEIEVIGLEQYTYFDYTDVKQIQLQSAIVDDYGIKDAYIIATVSKGSGESVKFREEQLNFKEPIQKGQRRLGLNSKIDLDDLKMEVGDELYFYIEAFDERTPTPNIARSETFFAVIKDTVNNQFGVEGTLGVDQMPDYFRSQRQLIIDTEKLIKDKPSISTQEFNSRSNELGFDQKALRLKYGQFMGDESEMAEAPEEIEIDELGEDHDHTEDQESILKEYGHTHDTENEHNLVSEKAGEEAEDPLHEYLHNHDDPEESTLFEESLKTKLRKALSIMWDAELYLRLYEPEKSLPFQYDALKLIQEIKNSARIYVHRIGFDPPPIKEDSRLTGEIKDVTNFRKTENLPSDEKYKFMQQAVALLEKLIEQQVVFSKGDNEVFASAGNELAQMAIDNPGKYLQTLQGLKQIENKTDRTIPNYKLVQKGLLSALPQPKQKPGGQSSYTDDINSLFLKKLEIYD